MVFTIFTLSSVKNPTDKSDEGTAVARGAVVRLYYCLRKEEDAVLQAPNFVPTFLIMLPPDNVFC